MEKCARCKKELGWQNMSCHQILNEWLCDECEELYKTYFEMFKQYFLNTVDNNDNDTPQNQEASQPTQAEWLQE
jgi:hypothetical protein